MWRLWQLFDPRTVLAGLFTFLITLALLIHFLLLGSSKYNWIDPGAKGGASQRSALPAK